jgi:transposase-like protein
MAKGKDRDGRLEAKWRRIIREHTRTGLNIRDFCRKSKLHESAFYFWRRELERRDVARREAEQRKRPSGQAAFVPVRVTEEVRSDAGHIEIVLSGGRRVHVVAPVDRQALADVLAVLAAASPERLECHPC